MNVQKKYLKKEFKMLLFDSDREKSEEQRDKKISIKVAFFVGFSVPIKSYK